MPKQELGFDDRPLRVAIVHYGEHVPTEEGYLPLRCGRLANYLHDRGVEVTRISPSFTRRGQQQRPMSWSGTKTDEGLILLAPTRSYDSSRGWDRLHSVRDFNSGAAKLLKDQPTQDLVIVGVPPPGLIQSVRSAIGPDVPILADIRDLWPDALLPNRSAGQILAPSVRGFGRLLAQEMRLATAVVGLSSTMLARAPRHLRSQVIPIGMTSSPQDFSELWPRPGDDTSFVFVGTFAPLFDFRSLFEGWWLLRQKHPELADRASMTLIGAGQRQVEVSDYTRNLAGVDLAGWFNTDQIPRLLAGCDIGIIPTRQGQGITLGNKANEYLDAGLYVLNSLEHESAEDLQLPRLGWRVASTPEGWAAGFARAIEQTEQLRRSRRQRLETARSLFGNGTVEEQWRHLIEGLVGRSIDSEAITTASKRGA